MSVKINVGDVGYVVKLDIAALEGIHNVSLMSGHRVAAIVSSDIFRMACGVILYSESISLQVIL